ncbi:MAG: hypothetical protein ACREEP_01095 [Dongiaceae bacterium]
MTDVEYWLQQHALLFQAITIGMTIVGFLFFMGGCVYRMMAAGEAITHEEAEELSRSMRDSLAWPYIWRRFTYRILGKTAGMSFRDEASFREVKEAWKRRAWREGPRWRSNFIIAGGALLMGIGLFGFVFVMGAPSIKMLVAVAIVYAAARVIWAFWHA